MLTLLLLLLLLVESAGRTHSRRKHFSAAAGKKKNGKRKTKSVPGIMPGGHAKLEQEMCSGDHTKRRRNRLSGEA